MSSAELAQREVKFKCYVENHYLTFMAFGADLAENKFMIFFFYFFQKNRILHFMQIVIIGDNLHEMSNMF